ncbi:P-loop containing nucleoside triphosphate hydrolase protein [Apiospora aurea]|uniref:P-loop containing nucleoside triphosphate hydrolase protein n=1 Tax=Apiospora aurea TaxID=335848 RepID=A0ABR1PZF3_9PEZI
MSFSTCKNDNLIGPNVSGCRDDFDFTVKFELVVFSVVPSAIFLVLALWRTLHLSRKPTIINEPALQLLKLGCITAYLGLQLALLVLAAARSLDVTALSISSTVLRFLAAIGLVPLSLLEHSRSARPSVLLNAYLFLSLLFDITQTRTFWLASGTRSEKANTALFTASVALKAIILLVEARRKRTFISKWDEKEHSPEETSGLYSLGVFFWLNRVFIDGYSKILQIDDLYPLDSGMRGRVLDERFARHVDYSKMKGHKYGLLKVLCRTLLMELLLPVAPRLVLLGFLFCQPFFIERLLTYLSEPEGPNSSNFSYGFIGAAVLIYSGIAVSTALYWYFHYRTLLKARGILVSTVYRKTLEAQLGTSDSTAAITLMSTDIERINVCFRSVHDVWASFFETGLASYLLYLQLGPAFVAPIVVVICCILAISVISRYTGDAQSKWMTAIQRRVGLTSTVIANTKNLKLSGLTQPVANSIQQLRVDEIASGSRFRKILIASAFFAWTPGVLSPFVTFAFASQQLGATKIFTSLSYVILLADPFSIIFQSVPQIIAGLACLGRIQKYLECETRSDFRSLINANETHEPSSTEKAVSKQEKGPSLSGNSPAITINEGSYGWTPENMVLHGINANFASSALTIVCGPVGCGKTSLCKALLGEIPFHSGHMRLRTAYRRVGFCDQTPFLSNGTVRQNIIGFSDFDEKRYREVLSATMLDVDLETLPSGEMTNVGSNGITLSGGQKQRVSLARALYLQSDLLILDDIFSGLDADTEEQVFQRVFGPDGIARRRNSTVILMTHSVKHLPAVDHIVALSIEGTVAEQGTYPELMANDGYIRGLGIKATESEASSTKLDLAADPQGPAAELLRQTNAISSIAPDMSKARHTGDRTVYTHYFRSIGWIVTAIIVFWAACFGFFQGFPNIWLTYWSADAAKGYEVRSWSYYIGIYSVLQMSRMLSLFMCAYFVLVTAVTKSGAKLHLDTLTTLMHAPLRFFTTTDNGQTTNLFSQDLNLVDMELPNALLNVVLGCFEVIAGAAVIMSSAPAIAVSYPFLALLLYFIQRFYLRTSRQMRFLDLEAKSPLYTHFRDTTHGIESIRAFDFMEEDREKNRQLLDTSQRPAYLLAMVQQWLVMVMNFVVMVLCVILTSLAVKLRSNSGFTGASLVSLMTFGNQIAYTVVSYTQLETSIGAVSRLRAFNETVKPEDRDDEDLVPADNWPEKGEIELKGIRASYNTEVNEDKEPVLALKNIDLSITPGEKIAICGRTGSGKSSLIAYLLKLLDPVPGKAAVARIDQTPLDRIDRPTLRRRIIAIPQEAVFLPDGSTFRANLDPFSVATEADCRSVLETVDLWAFVEDRGGLEAGMSAGTFSQGQRQIFSLARAVLRRRVRARGLGLGQGAAEGEGGVLLLDEVSSSVDLETERAMQNIIRVEFQKYTVVAVNHRLDMVMDFDRVVVMSNGEIVEIGPPKVLAEDESTRFGELCRREKR